MFIPSPINRLKNTQKITIKILIESEFCLKKLKRKEPKVYRIKELNEPKK